MMLSWYAVIFCNGISDPITDFVKTTSSLLELMYALCINSKLNFLCSSNSRMSRHCGLYSDWLKVILTLPEYRSGIRTDKALSLFLEGGRIGELTSPRYGVMIGWNDWDDTVKHEFKRGLNDFVYDAEFEPFKMFRRGLSKKRWVKIDAKSAFYDMEIRRKPAGTGNEVAWPVTF